MRTNARSLPALASALLLAASAAAVSGCAKPEAKPPQLTAGNVVTVVVVYDQGPPATAVMLDMGPDKTSTLYKDKDRIQWVSPDGVVHVTFGDLPFDGPPKHEKKVLKSGIAKKTGQFPYTAELWLDAEGKDKVKIDPRIVIMP
jgi:hypothetical protein